MIRINVRSKPDPTHDRRSKSPKACICFKGRVHKVHNPHVSRQVQLSIWPEPLTAIEGTRICLKDLTATSPITKFGWANAIPQNGLEKGAR